MELPRPLPVSGEGGRGGRKSTHDFLSLYTHSFSSSSTPHQDPATRPPPPPPSTSPRENSLKTRDFLGRTTGKEEAASHVASYTERLHPAVAPPLQTLPIPSSVDHGLPGGIGTYSISHVSYFTHELPVPKLETTVTRPFTVVQARRTDRTDDNSNFGSYANSGFMLGEEFAGKKGKTRKENVHSAATADRESKVQLGGWSTSDKPALSSSINNHRQSPFSSLSSSLSSGQKNKGFVDMLKSAKGSSSQEDEFQDEEIEFMIKKESSHVPRELTVKIDGKCSEQKANTPRSKHSATEQRRRSKINDRFQMLRAIIPRSDEKRDRASFLMEVIEYIKMLQEKVTKYEGSYPGWTPKPAKSMPLRNGQKPGDSFIDQSRPTTNGSNTTMVFTTKVDEDNDSMMSDIPRSAHEPSETDVTSSTAFKAAVHPLGIGSNAFPFPVSLHPNLSAYTRDGRQAGHVSQNMAAGFGSKTRAEECGTSALSNKLKEEGLAVDGGSMSFSNEYSHGLLNVLTQVLQSSGVDLSQSSISVQIELGESRNPSVAATSPFPKDIDAASKMHCVTRTRVGAEDSDQVLKKLKTCEEARV